LRTCEKVGLAQFPGICPSCSKRCCRGCRRRLHRSCPCIAHTAGPVHGSIPSWTGDRRDGVESCRRRRRSSHSSSSTMRFCSALTHRPEAGNSQIGPRKQQALHTAATSPHFVTSPGGADRRKIGDMGSIVRYAHGVDVCVGITALRNSQPPIGSQRGWRGPAPRTRAGGQEPGAGPRGRTRGPQEKCIDCRFSISL
jgi:hypothetical protein